MSRIRQTLVALSVLVALAPDGARSQSAASAETSSKTAIISGNAGEPAVRMAGLPGTPATDMNGNYSVSVPHEWRGVVAPSKAGYAFEPAKREYSHVKKDLPNQDYASHPLLVTISDRMVMDDEPIQDVHITAEPGGYSAVTDAKGWYSIQVPYGWSGQLRIAKEGFAFEPPSMSYDSVTSDIVDGVPVSRGQRAQSRGPRALPTFAAAVAGDNVLVVPTQEVAPEQFAQTAEDMRVMLNILREKLSEPRTIRGVLYDYGDFFADAGRTAEALYLQGHAAIFLLKVDFPLSAPTTQGQAASQKAEPADPVWQRARDRLYSPQRGGPYGARGVPLAAQERSFDQIKEDLIQTLKHAANIRNIDPNESIILTVAGQSDAAFPGTPYGFGGGAGGGGWMWGGASGGGGGSVSGGGMGGYGGRYSSSSFNYSGGGSFQTGSGMQMGMGGGGGAMGRGRSAPAAPDSTTVLTIQAKKADIDAFAQGTLSSEQFQQKVKVFTY
ncbi:MAG: hypothetical protein JW955_13660 [Sedimentisphaerales bacterium]|nr:hypothetical protein [Sedimentisphaerales bacterium]